MTIAIVPDAVRNRAFVIALLGVCAAMGIRDEIRSHIAALVAREDLGRP
jgi:hypothetical protein